MDKKFNRGFVFTLLVATSCLALSGIAFAVNENAPVTEHKQVMRDAGKTLNLSPEQKQQIQQQHSMNMEKMKGLRQSLRAKRLELRQELDKPNVDRNKVSLITGEIKALMSQQLDMRVDNILATKQILTPEQFKKMQENRKAKGNSAGVKEHKETPAEY